MESLPIQHILTMIARFGCFWQCFSAGPGLAARARADH
jgi:hypothetical protein